MRIACWMHKTTNTLRLYNTYCFPLQQWLHERASMLCYTYIACIVEFLQRQLILYLEIVKLFRDICTHANTHIHTHIHKDRHTHIYTHTDTHTHTPTHTPTHTHPHTHTDTHIQIHTHIFFYCADYQLQSQPSQYNIHKI